MAKSLDLTGQIFGELTVIRKAEPHITKGGNKKSQWFCKCNCGNYLNVNTGSLRSGNTKSCGCYKLKSQHDRCSIDEVGNIYGRLTVVSYYGATKDGKSIWECSCECGNETNVIGYSLRRGATKSCGCLRDEFLFNKSSHGMSSTRQYKIWIGVKSRCLNIKDTSYKYYGAKGVTICDEWIDSFENFWEDMKDGYSDDLELDRILTSRGYYKENCRWVSRSDNMYNTSPYYNSTSKYKGVSFSNKFRTMISFKGTVETIGYFQDEIEAALAYDKKAEELFGEFAWLNRNYFPEVKEQYDKCN